MINISATPLPPYDAKKVQIVKQQIQQKQKDSEKQQNLQKEDSTFGGLVLMAWLLAFLLLFLFSRTRTGYVVLYYLLWLAIFSLLLGSYDRLLPLLNVFSLPTNSSGPSGDG